jgi:hypothetical protein
MPYKDKTKKSEHHKAYMRDVWYPKNKKKHINYVNKTKKKISLYILDYKRNSICFDCRISGKDHPEVLDFDHISKDKEFNISEFRFLTSSINKVKKEIEKCDMVCSNCHRIRTSRRIMDRLKIPKNMII